jgi:sec-independent protein translocase protein TatA
MLSSFGFLGLGTPELLIILAIALLLFGGKKLPELSRSLGQSIKEIKGGLSEANNLKKSASEQITQTKQAIRGEEQTEKA